MKYFHILMLTRVLRTFNISLGMAVFFFFFFFFFFKKKIKIKILINKKYLINKF